MIIYNQQQTKLRCLPNYC